MHNKIAIGIEYDGTHYCGWQRQVGQPSIQAEIERALSAVADAPVRVHCAGRTDTGVHALEQVAHFETSAERSEKAWVFGANTHLPRDIRMLWTREVSEDFHARFSAKSRRYQYHILNARVASSLKRNQWVWVPQPLKVEFMQQAALCLVGEHDFNAFRARQCQAKSSVRTVDYIQINRHHENIMIDIKANAFLHHMVRNIVGTLILIGEGKRPPEWMQQVLKGKNRAHAGPTAPAHGLYFVEVDYASAHVPKSV